MTKKIKQETKKQDVKFVIYKNKVVPCINTGQGIENFNCFPYCRIGLEPIFKSDGSVFCKTTLKISCFEIFDDIRSAEAELNARKFLTIHKIINDIEETQKLKEKKDYRLFWLLYILCVINFVGFICFKVGIK